MFDHRLKLFTLLGILGGLGLAAHAEKEFQTGTAVPVIAAEAAPANAATDARAKALGFAAHLPKDTEGYLGVFDGRGFLKDLRASKLGKFLESRGAEEGFDPDDLNEEPTIAMALGLFAEEFAIAVGKGTPRQADNLIRLSETSNYQQMKFMVKMLDAEIRGEELEDPGVMLGMQEMMLLGGLIHGPDGGLAILEQSHMPPITLAFKMSDPDALDELAGMLRGGVQEAIAALGPDGENIAAPVKFKRAGSQFNGLRLVGRKIAAKIGDDEKEDLAEILDAASIERFVNTIAAKELTLATGVHDSYLVVFLGSDRKDLQLAESVAESLAGSADLDFTDAYLKKKLFAVSTMSKELQEGLTRNSTAFGGMARGIRDGLKEAEGFGDTRDLEVLLGLVEEQEKALFDLITYTPAGVVAYREKGLKIESFGGAGTPDLNLEKPHRYGKLADWDGAFLFANYVEDREYTDRALEYLDTLGETTYLAAKRISTLEAPDGDLADFKEGFTLFDKRIRPHALNLWKAFREDLNAGLGDEGAIIVDLKGGLPTVPGLPQTVADKGKAPRIGIVSPIKDPAKVSASWKKVNGALEGLLAVYSEMSGTNIPMQRPMSSEEDDLKTWFFSIQFQNDDFVLSVSQDKENFYLTTSKDFVKELSATLAGAAPDPSRKGAYLEVDFKALHAFARDWLKLLNANAADIFGGERGAEEFRRNLPMIREAVAAFSDLDSLRIHTRNEGGATRSSLHFKVN